MILSIVKIVRIYGPIIISAVLLFLMFSIKETQDLGRISINPTFFGVSIFEYDGLPVSNIWVARAVLLFFAILVFSYLIFMDYSSFFLNNLQMEVFFDQEGIRNSLKIFREQELKKLKIPDKYEQFQKKYDDDVNIVLKYLSPNYEDFVLRREDIHSQGHTSFATEKLRGIFKYHIKESEGSLTNVIERANKPTLQFKSFFEKLNSQYDYLSPTFKDIFIKRSVILQPRFKQIFAENLKSEGKSFHHTLVGLTRVSFLPFPKFSNTIYLTELKGTGLIPIAYAIYT